jgi:hypothetical protein
MARVAISGKWFLFPKRAFADGTRFQPNAAGDGVSMAAGTFSNLLAMATQIYGRFPSLRA